MVDTSPLIELEPHLFVFQGVGVFNVNSLVLEDADGLTLIDTQLEDANNHALIAAIKQRWPTTPLRTVVISHYHLDHYLGLAFVREAFGAVTIIGPPNPQPSIAASTATIWESYVEQSPNAALTPADVISPTRTVTGPFTIPFSGRIMEWRLAGPNEAWATLTGFLPDTHTLFASDIYFGGIFIDPRIGGTVLGWCREARRLLDVPCERVICGHGTRFHHREELVAFVASLEQFVAEAQALVADECDLDTFLKHSFASDVVVYGREFSLTNIYQELRAASPMAR